MLTRCENWLPSGLAGEIACRANFHNTRQRCRQERPRADAWGYPEYVAVFMKWRTKLAVSPAGTDTAKKLKAGTGADRNSSRQGWIRR